MHSLESFSASGTYFRSGTQYWIKNVTRVVRAAAALAALAASPLPNQCFNHGMSKVTADAARTPALTLALGAQLVGAAVAAGAAVAKVAAGVAGGSGPPVARIGSGVVIFFPLFQRSMREDPAQPINHINGSGVQIPFPIL